MQDGVRVFRRFRSVSGYWAAIVRDNPEMLVYQSVEWNRHIAFVYRTNRYLLRTVRVRYFSCSDPANPGSLRRWRSPGMLRNTFPSRGSIPKQAR